MGCSGVGKVEDHDYIKQMLIKHNEIRKNHNAQKLNLNKELNELAKYYVHKIKNNKENIEPLLYKEHALGENIFISETGLSPEEIFEAWYNEHKNYNYKINKFQKGTGHFTQLVWKETQEVGFGKFEDGHSLYFVALYYPAGNEFGEFTNNVFEFNKNDNDNKDNNK